MKCALVGSFSRFVTAFSLAAIVTVTPLFAAPVAAGGTLRLFASEASAQTHCPRDVVVWLNTMSGIYHEQGMRWYGRTRHGAYVCRKEADAAGDRDTRNGQ